MHVDMIFAHYSFEYSHVLGIADLNEQVTAPDFDVALKHVVSVLRSPDQMDG